MASQTVQIQGSVSGLGSLAGKDVVTGADLAADTVTFANLQNIVGSRLLGRGSAGTGDVEEIQVGAGLRLNGRTLTASGAGNYVGVVDHAASAAITVADLRKLVSTTKAAINLTLDPVGFVPGYWIDVANLAGGPVTLTAGTGGAINRVGQASVTVLPQQIVRIVYRGTVTPAWAVDIGEFQILDDQGTADGWILGRAGSRPAWRSPAQARVDLGVPDRVTWLPFSIPDPVNRTYALPFIPYAASVDALDYRCAGGLRSAMVTVQIADQDDANPTAITGMSGLAATAVRQGAVAPGHHRVAASGAADRTILVTVGQVAGTSPSRLDLSLKLTRNA